MTQDSGSVLKPVERYRHVKRGTTYEVIGTAELQMNCDLLVDGSAMVVYRGEDGKLWVREESEFHDGRFERLSATPPAAPSEVLALREDRNNLFEALKLVNGWLIDVAACDMDEIVADGGITGAMVVRQEAGHQQKRVRAAIARSCEARAALQSPAPQPPSQQRERTDEIERLTELLKAARAAVGDAMIVCMHVDPERAAIAKKHLQDWISQSFASTDLDRQKGGEG